MNKVILVGRLTRDPELKNTNNNIAVCRFTLAVDRRFKNQNGEKETDFITCVAWRSQAEFINRYFGKGNRIGIIGNIQTRTWDNNGQRQYMTEVIVDEVEFVESRNNGDGSSYRNNNFRSNSGSDNGSSNYATKEVAVPSYEPDDNETALPFDL